MLSTITFRTCLQDTLSSRAALGLPAKPLGRVRRASKGILHTNLEHKIELLSGGQLSGGKKYVI